MFTKSKITQSMIDAVNSVIAEEDKKLLLEPEKKSTKIATPTGTKVLGHRYGNSAKAHKDQTSHDVDKLKGPKAKEMKEEDGSCVTEPEAKNIAKKEVKGHEKSMHHAEEMTLAHKWKEKAKAKIKENKGSGPQETFTDNNMGEEVRKSDVPAFLRKAKGEKPLTMTDVKGPKKDTISHKDNLAKARNEWKEEVELSEAEVTTPTAQPNEVTTDMIRGRVKGGNANEFKSYKLQLKTDGEMKAPAVKDAEETTARKSIKAKEPHVNLPNLKMESATDVELDAMINEVLSKDADAGDWIHDFIHSKNPKFAGKSKAERKKMALGAYYGKKNEEADEGSWHKETPWKKSPATVTDKSGAKHTPMSRAKDLARSAFKKLKNETMMGKISN